MEYYTIKYSRDGRPAFCQGKMTLEMAEMNARLSRALGWTCEVLPC